MTNTDYRHAAATNVAEALDSAPAASTDELRKALANAMDRIASLESDGKGLEQWLKALNEYVDAVIPRSHGL